MQLLQHCLLHTITETLSLSQLLRLGSFDNANMSTCVAQSAQRRTSIPDITGSNPQAAIRHNTFK